MYDSMIEPIIEQDYAEILKRFGPCGAACGVVIVIVITKRRVHLAGGLVGFLLSLSLSLSEID